MDCIISQSPTQICYVNFCTLILSNALSVLQQHYRNLEAIALEHEQVETVADLTEPDLERISRRAGGLLQEFKEMVYPPGYDPEGKGGAKRKVHLVCQACSCAS